MVSTAAGIQLLILLIMGSMVPSDGIVNECYVDHLGQVWMSRETVN
jgi:hypothetical protein